MNLTLKRFEFGTTYTIGKLYNGEEMLCYVLEDKYREVAGKPVAEWKVPNETAIPKGTYKVIVDHSNHFNKDLPHILNVPGYEGVRIHSGNTSKDTEGCLLVGSAWPGGDMITGSKVAFDKVFPLIQAAKDVTITIG
jgi:hypothetical protein